jgi:hypothetical protein
MSAMNPRFPDSAPDLSPERRIPLGPIHEMSNSNLATALLRVARPIREKEVVPQIHRITRPGDERSPSAVVAFNAEPQ